MEKMQLLLSEEGKNNQAETISVLIEAANELSNATEADFERMKSKKWYKRLWEVVTFSKDNQKVMARNVGNLAKLQEIVMQALLVLSKESSEMANALFEHEELLNQLAVNHKKTQKVLCAIITEVERIKTGIRQTRTIDDLNQDEKTVVFNVVGHIAENLDDCSDNGKQYFRLLKSATSSDIQEGIALEECVSNLGIWQSELLYRTVMEYLYLATGIFECDDEILDYMNVNNKKRDAIQSLIEKLVKLGGDEALLDFYQDDILYLEDGGIEFVEAEEETAPTEDIAAETEDSESLGAVSLDPDNVAVIARNLFNKNLEQITLDELSDIHSDTVYKHKIIDLEGIISCTGKLTFEECIIRYDLDSNAKVYANNNSEISFINCHIQQKDRNNTEKSDNYLISTEDEEEAAKLTIKGCYITKSENLIDGLKVKDIEIFHNYFQHCRSLLCFMDYNTSISNEALFDSNVIVTKPVEDRYFMYGYQYCSLLYSCNQNIKIRNCVIIGEGDEVPEDHNYQYVFSCEDNQGKIQNCTFINSNRCMNMSNTGVNNIVFYKCREPIEMRRDSIIRDSIFIECTGRRGWLVDDSYGNLLDITDSCVTSCQFINCHAPIINGGEKLLFEDCEFINIKTPEGGTTVFDFDGFNNHKRSVLGRCTFNGINLGNSKFAECRAYEKLKTYEVSIEKCSFKNIKSKYSGEDIIDTHATYSGTFSSSVVQTICIDNCVGLNKVNRESDHVDDVTIKETDNDGKRIGANIPGNMPTNIETYAGKFFPDKEA